MTERCKTCERENGHHEDCPNYAVAIDDMLYLDRLIRIPASRNVRRVTIGEE